MDIKSIVESLTKADILSNIAGASKTDAADAKSVIENAVSPLMKGALGSANLARVPDIVKKYAGSFPDLAKNLDLADGKKLLGELLGRNEAATVSEISRASGVSEAKTGSILSAAAPLVANLLGNELQNGGDLSSLAADFMKNMNVTDLLGGLFGGIFGGN